MFSRNEGMRAGGWAGGRAGGRGQVVVGGGEGGWERV